MDNSFELGEVKVDDVPLGLCFFNYDYIFWFAHVLYACAPANKLMSLAS
jgi:hypothetical protein